ncbi:hypothetical protein E2C11_16625 [Streptomyces lavendulae]|nr:hypothetical protein [Streptomyces lavendulae]TXJ78631.1 hypothetical protein E2C11_16625 [Streptomyces lavendulae]
MTHTITTTMQPDKQIEVSDTEYLDLKRQGLIATGGDPQPTPELAAEPTATTITKPVKPAAIKEG